MCRTFEVFNMWKQSKIFPVVRATLFMRRWFRIAACTNSCVGLNVVYWLSGVGSAQAANTSAALKPLFFQRGPVIWKVGVNVALGLDVADVCCQFGKVH